MGSTNDEASDHKEYSQVETKEANHKDDNEVCANKQSQLKVANSQEAKSTEKPYHSHKNTIYELDSDSIEVLPCLGNSFELGMLYNCYTNEIIPKINLWDKTTLQTILASHDKRRSGFQVISEDTLNEKYNLLGIGGNLAMHHLTNQTNTTGGLGLAGYLTDYRSSSSQARVVIKCWSDSRFEEIPLQALKNPQYLSINEFLQHHTATHIVSGLLYGADAIFVFDKVVHKNESYREVHENMRLSLPALIDGSLTVPPYENVFFNVHSDISLPLQRGILKEAIKCYRKNNILEILSHHKTIPKMVHLVPLKSILGKPVIVKNIAKNLTERIKDILQKLQEFEIEAKDMQSLEICKTFPELKNHLICFRKVLHEHQVKLTKNLASKLQEVLIGTSNEWDMFNVLTHSNEEQLHAWLVNKKKEIHKISEIFGDIQMFKFIALTDLQNNSLCLLLSLVDDNDPYVQKIDLMGSHVLSPTYWYMDQETVQNIQLKIKIFKEFTSANTSTTAVITHKSNSNKGALILFCRQGNLTEFTPPGQPGKPVISNVTYNSAVIKWDPPNHGQENVESYSVIFLCVNTRRQFTVTKITNPYVEITNLDPNTVYSFTVQAVCKAGSSLPSNKSENVMTQCIPFRVQMLKSATPLSDKSVPQVFKLPLTRIMENKNLMIAQYDIGKKCISNSRNKVLMLIGASGVGKTTLINALVNYVFGVERSDNFRFKLIEEKLRKSQAHSQTRYITAYTIHQAQNSTFPYTLTIIDTPGFGDTEGLKRDKFIVTQIKEFFSLTHNGIDHMDGIGFVIKSTLTRLDAKEKYIIKSILSIFGKDIGDNIFMMLTFCDGKQPNAINAIREAKIPSEKFFKFNNSAVFSSTDTGPNIEDDDSFDEMFWKMGFKSFEKFLNEFIGIQSKRLDTTKQVLIERQQLEVVVQGIRPEIDKGLMEISQMEKEEDFVRRYTDSIQARQELAKKNFVETISRPVTKTINLEVGQHVTNCLQCNRTCHFPCYIPNDGEKYRCWAMNNQSDENNAYCRVCAGGCRWNKHVNVPYRYEITTEYEQITYEDLKSKYNADLRGKKDTEALIKAINQRLSMVHQRVLTLVKKVQLCLRRLDEIALVPNPLTEVGYLELLIETEKQEAQSGYLNRIKWYQKALEEAKTITAARNVSENAQPTSQSSEGWREWLNSLVSNI